MNNWIISSDSSCDLYKSEQEENEVSVIPLTFIREKDGEFTDMEDSFNCYQDYVDFYNEIRNGATFKTSQISKISHYEYFKKIIEEKECDVLHFCLSSGLSSTYDRAVEAANELNAENRKYKVYVIDSTSATVGLAQLVIYATRLKNNNATIEEVFSAVQEVKHKLQHWFFVSDLNHLKKGGRVSTIQAAVGSFLNVRPMLTIDRNGKLQVVEKNRGDKKSISSIIDKYFKFAEDLDYQRLHIVHTDCEESAKQLRDLLNEHIKVNIPITIMGPTIGSHVGPGALALTFFGGERYSHK